MIKYIVELEKIKKRMVGIKDDTLFYIDTKEEVPTSDIDEAKLIYESKKLQKLSEDKAKEISTKAEEKIISGFTSSALGTPGVYLSDRDDQLNLIGLVVNGGTEFLRVDGVYKSHTATELAQVLADGKLVKENIFQQALVFREALIAATNGTLITADDYIAASEQVSAINVVYYK